MPRRHPGFPDPGAGLRALADLVAAAMAALADEPLPAGGPFGALPVRQAMDTSTIGPAVPRTRSHLGLSGGRRREPTPPAGDGTPPEDADGTTMDVEHQETWRLVTLAQAGDGEAFGQLYDRYVDLVYRFIYFRVNNDRGLAEDFTSETFLRALRRITTISYQGRDIGAWFITIARNIILDHVKSARNRLETTTGEVIESREVAPSTEASVLETLDNQQLLAAIHKLGDEQRECVTLRFMQGMSVAETAAIMGKNEGAVKALQHRAVRKLAELVGDNLR